MRGRWGWDAPVYDLEMVDGVLTSVVRSFTSAETSFVPFSDVMPDESNMEKCLLSVASRGKAAMEAFRSLLVFDMLVCTVDRHGGNFGFMRDNASGTFLRLAPLFGYGTALFSAVPSLEMFDLTGIASSMRTVIGDVSYDALFGEIVRETQLHMLWRVLDFRFRRHPLYNLPEYRLRAIEQFLSKRVRMLLRVGTERIAAGLA